MFTQGLNPQTVTVYATVVVSKDGGDCCTGSPLPVFEVHAGVSKSLRCWQGGARGDDDASVSVLPGRRYSLQVP